MVRRCILREVDELVSLFLIKPTKSIPGFKPHRFTHQLLTFPRLTPPSTGSGPSFDLSSGPPQISNKRSSHFPVKMFVKFIPLASDTSMGAKAPRKTEAIKDETREILEVASYTSGFNLRICFRVRVRECRNEFTFHFTLEIWLPVKRS